LNAISQRKTKFHTTFFKNTSEPNAQEHEIV
jgi:hypothetical protein